MGAVCEKSASDKSLEAKDPPVATPEEDKKPAAAHVYTVNLTDPPVDVNAALDERDIELVQQTFARVATLGNETVGWLLFMNIFNIAPGAKALFPFKDDDLATSTKMKVHGGKVIATVGTAVSLLRDLPTLVPVLHELGLKHVGFSVVPEHYDVVGQALIKCLSTSLGPNMTPAVTNAYLKVYGVVKTTMLEKCDYSKLTQAAG